MVYDQKQYQTKTLLTDAQARSPLPLLIHLLLFPPSPPFLSLASEERVDVERVLLRSFLYARLRYESFTVY